MSSTIIIAIISLCGTCFGSIAGVMTANKLTNYRIAQLEQKVEKHNQLVERTYCLEQAQQLTEERLRVANHRISDLERKEEQI